MDIHVDGWKRSFSATTIYNNGNIIVSLGGTNTGRNKNPENMGIVDIQNLDIRVIGGNEFAAELNRVYTKKEIEGIDKGYTYKRIALECVFKEFVKDPVGGYGTIEDMLKEARRKGYEAGKYELRTKLKDLLCIDGY